MKVKQSLTYFIDKNPVENPINKVIKEIVDSIKYHKNYDYAIELMIENELTLENITFNTVRLKKEELAKFADILILRNNGKQ